MKFVALSSSRGSTFQAVLDAIKNHTLNAQCLGLITDKADAQCREKAQAAGLPAIILEKLPDESRETYDVRLSDAIRDLGTPDVICALGWLRILSADFVKAWRIINVHPSLLPKYGGKGMYGHNVHQAVLDAGEDETGITIHLMDAGVDTGKILLQKTCEVHPGDSVEDLCRRVQKLEREWYPKLLQMIEEGKVSL